MGRTDIAARQYMEDNSRFADTFNYFLYNGEPVIDPGALTAVDTAQIAVPYGNDADEPTQRFRDVFKNWNVKTDGNTVYAVLGTEIEYEVNYAMPVKAGLYDFMFYGRQVREARKTYKNGKRTMRRRKAAADRKRTDRVKEMTRWICAKA